MLSEDREAIRVLKRDFDELATLTETNINAHLSSEKRMRHYTTVFTAATRNETDLDEYLGYPICEILYNDYQEMLSHFLLSLRKRIVNVNEERCIGVIIEIWKRYKVLMSENIHIFSYLSRFYIVNQNKRSLKNVGLSIFWELILKRHINTLVSFVITSIANQVHIMHDASWTPELIECVRLIYSINEEHAHFNYEGNFLAPLLVALRDRYASLLTQWVAELGSLALVNKLIHAIAEAQSFFALHFAQSDVLPIMECVEDVFLSSITINKVLVWPSMIKHTWNEDDDGIVYHILHKDEDALSKYYLLFSRREHTLAELARLTTRAIIIHGNTIANKYHIYTQENTLIRYIHALLEMEFYYTTEVMSCFDHAAALHKAVCDGLESVFNQVVSIHVPSICESDMSPEHNEVKFDLHVNSKDSNVTNASYAVATDNLDSKEAVKELISESKMHYGTVKDKNCAHVTKIQYAQLLAHYIHQEICKCNSENYCNDTSMKDNSTAIIEAEEETNLNRAITEVIHILNYIHDREVFFSTLRDLLAQRILFPLYTFNQDNEKLLIKRFREQYGSEKTAYLEGILHDYNESVEFNYNSNHPGTIAENDENNEEKSVDGQQVVKVEEVREISEIKNLSLKSTNEDIHHNDVTSKHERTELRVLEPHPPLLISLLAIKKGVWPAWVTTITHDEWILPTWLSDELDALRSSYLANTHDRLLHWALDSSYSEVEYDIIKQGNHTENNCDIHDANSSAINTMILCLSALQALILLLFNKVERCTMSELSHELHASSEDLTNALIPLVRFHILSFASPHYYSSSSSSASTFSSLEESSSHNCPNTSRTRSTNDTLSIVTITHKLESNELLCVSIDAYYAHCLPPTKTKIILHPSLLSSTSSFDALDTWSSENKSKYDHSVVLDLILMKLMKADRTLPHQKLISHCQSEILRHFSVEPHLIKERIDNLLQRGYIVRDRMNHNIYHYQP